LGEERAIADREQHQRDADREVSLGRPAGMDRRTFLAAVVATGALLAGCGRRGNGGGSSSGPATTVLPAHWRYEGEEGPAHWGELDPAYMACSAGKAQSPIDIVNPVPSGKAPPTVAYRAGATEIVNNGHTVQANPPSGLSLKLDGADYELLQAHFHSPGEHAFAGRSGPVELHFVHRGASGTLAVLGFLVQAGPTHPAWQPFVDALRTREGDRATIQLDWPRLVPATATTIRYAGSLTTPPCTEGVQWLVAQEPLTLGNAQIKAFSDAYSGNNRPRRPLEGAVVTIDSLPR
jgi:carbonic anhydrase